MRYRLLPLFFMAVMFFVSCGKNVELSKEKFTAVQQGEPSTMSLTTMLQYRPFFIRWEKGNLVEKNALSPKPSWNRFMAMNPEGFVIRKKSPEGITQIPAVYIENIEISPNRSLAAFTIKLGSSLNGSVGIADIRQKKVIFNEEVEDRPAQPPARMSIAIRDAFFKPVFSDDSRYLAYTRYNYLNTRHIRIRNITDGTFNEIDNAMLPQMAGGNIYYMAYKKGNPALMLMKRGITGGDAVKIGDVTENMVNFMRLNNSVYLATWEGFYEVANGSLVKKFDFEDIKKYGEQAEITAAYLSSQEGLNYLFLTVKHKKDGDYKWRVYGRLF
ncbi:MAG: hypothetical protein CVV21_12615 [Candidatus Goldiibacteriota bacterium HGW-Goldbacteria-1]|jgi:hypothetical protein|nr:MAG: hypothetical protein CVV21_12615 [Candidatus Goldiibacteriota bacterium HGW-Goldbacteria-1]